MTGSKARQSSSQSVVSPPYPRPKAVGGGLIRRVVGFAREAGLEFPITSHILIATSGGLDSVALAHLVVHYGRRVGARSQVSLLHMNHGWRGAESDGDETFVRGLGKAWGVPVIVHRLKPAKLESGAESLEDLARSERKRIFAAEAKKRRAVILTAHHADDLAETLLWRVFTGSAGTHGGGIVARHGEQIRPLLRIRKSELAAYLHEEGVLWREDRTNHEGRFLRSKMRLELLPVVERLFPRAVEHLTELALRAQLASTGRDPGAVAGEVFAVATLLAQQEGIKLRRGHHREIQKAVQAGSAGELHLPEGWKLVYTGILSKGKVLKQKGKRSAISRS